ncbi:predicted protein [Plenodomus lingam JN3]|uniref:Predicted protein n=1 Tax=Leptosphaeria maculans (strain JN3 / isolate v23.1.3 / race Av1-4-5-6-7-8) TaxID=985895 RepID=E5A2P1_LEPMJ|nr:predicted protein [Plenodomus lingam JN3]CBX97837.1 predicted protein [Plenodomus lingam JN3]
MCAPRAGDSVTGGIAFWNATTVRCKPRLASTLQSESEPTVFKTELNHPVT